MKIDFSQGIDYWKSLWDQLLSYINDFWRLLTGSPLFSNTTTDDKGLGYEPFDRPTLDD